MYHAARARTGDERRKFLEEACTADIALRRDLESLLALSDAGGDFLEAPALAAAAELASVSSPNLTGLRLGPFVLLGRIGAGGMGEVYRARDTRLGRDVAIKILPRVFTSDRDRLARFEREAHTLAALNHPHIAAIYGVEEDEGIRGLVLELVEGDTLTERIKRGPVAVGDIMRIARQIADALRAAHEKGIIHRDLKPSNIMETRDGSVKILDFGLAKTVPSAGRESEMATYTETQTGIALGTIAYMSPEQARGEPTDVRTDIFSFGLVLYEMATGRRPFAAQTEAVLFDALLNHPPPPIGAVAPDVPAALDRIITRALAKKPADRYPRVVDLLQDLKAVGGEASESAVGRRAPTDPRAGGPSIAVLPFANLSADPDQEYFCDGMAEELIGVLAKIKGLSVAARTSSFQMKGQAVDVRQVGERLNVQTVVEGSVRRIGTRLRITAQLINVSDGYHLWAERYDRTMDDVFAIQDEIAKAIAGSLEVTLATGASKPIVRRATDNLEAYNLYLRGRYLMNQLTADIGASLAHAVRCFEQALELDPSYAGAHAGLSECYNTLGYYTFMSSFDASQKAMASAERALGLDAGLAEAHTSLGWVKTCYGIDLATAEHDFLRAIDLAPSYAPAHGYYAVLLMARGRFDEALARVSQARQLDPLWLINRYIHCHVFIAARQFERAASEMEDLLELNATLPGTYWYLSMALGGQRKFDQAIPVLEKGVELVHGIPLYVGHLALLYAHAGRRAEAEAILQQLLEQPMCPPFLIAILYGALGNRDQAFAYLEKALERHNESVSLMGVDWRFDSLRGDPRFAAVLKRVGLPA